MTQTYLKQPQYQMTQTYQKMISVAAYASISISLSLSLPGDSNVVPYWLWSVFFFGGIVLLIKELHRSLQLYTCTYTCVYGYYGLFEAWDHVSGLLVKYSNMRHCGGGSIWPFLSIGAPFCGCPCDKSLILSSLYSGP